MMDLANALGSFLSIGLGGALTVAFFLYLARAAVARAITQAAQMEIEKRKAELAKGVEEYKQTLARELEEVRARAAKDLETFKAELTLAAEVRRHVAALRVAALVSIVEQGDSLGRLATGIRNPEEDTKAADAFLQYIDTVRLKQYLFSHDVAAKLSSYASTAMAEAALWRENKDTKALERLANAYREYVDLVRAELRVLMPLGPDPTSVSSAAR